MILILYKIKLNSRYLCQFPKLLGADSSELKWHLFRHRIHCSTKLKKEQLQLDVKRLLLAEFVGPPNYLNSVNNVVIHRQDEGKVYIIDLQVIESA